MSSRPTSPPAPSRSLPSPSEEEADAPLSASSHYHDPAQSLVEYDPLIDEGEASEADRTWQTKLWTLWLVNKGMFYVIASQAFGASMNVVAQILENKSGMDPFQILFARMSITALASYLYMLYAKVPAPLGTRPVIPLLLGRAVFGFFGVYGMFLLVITFLSPIMACYACSFLIPGDTFSWRQQVAAVVSLVGVVLIARPFGSSSSPSSDGDGHGNPSSADSYHHILATIVAFVGAFGAAGAFTTIRMIGTRAHALVSVTYFSLGTCVISLVAMLLPWVPFRLPSTVLEWTLLLILGICGFLLQYLLTAGLSYAPPPGISKNGQGSRATQGIYSQLLFALLYDKAIWGATLSPLSWIGSALILGCAIYVAMAQEEPAKPKAEEMDHAGFKDC
ncbi:hypothetical protein N7468_000182 [Penicillium chermesinum]|uniref:EamA domain-containing protein n=1 Tax=Penicillium chermesinum TaxID=63820 RepID=A0A9W9PJS3_9EURO|nr:uncharacterized protein N7468_000182 [Penicillium chermesinum]KAJ5248731.1 hypothetical protein N7468_000182 [Penicillium chermesinum]